MFKLYPANISSFKCFILFAVFSRWFLGIGIDVISLQLRYPFASLWILYDSPGESLFLISVY